MGTSFAGCCKRVETRDACVGTGDKDIYGGRIVSVRSPKYGARRYERYTATEGEEVHSVVSQPVSTESFMDLRSNSSHGMDHSSLERINSFATIIRTRDVRTTKKLEEVEIERRAEMMHAENTLFGSMKLMIDLVPHCPNSEATSKLLLTLSSAHLADSSENFYDCMSPRLMDYRSPRLAGTRSMRLNRMNSAVSSSRSRLESTSSGMLLKQLQIDFDYKKTKNVDCVTTEDWDVTWNIPEAAEILSRGDAIMNFCCRPASDLSERERALANLVINVNSIYSVEDGYPSTDLYLEDDVERYTMIITRATYLLPDLNLVELTPQLIASPGYQKGCLPGNPYLWPQQGTSDEDMRTFRLTKSLVPFVYSMVIQMRVSEITDPDVLQRLREIDNIPITRVLLLERTRRNKNATDSTAKVRSLLMYYRLPDGKGVLMTNFTVVCNNFIPKIVAAVVQSFGSKGASEIAETVKRTRKYFTAPENKHLVL